MNIDQVNRWLKLAGNVGALVGIALLIMELNQNSRMVKTQTRNAITESILNFQFNSATSGLMELSAPSAIHGRRSENGRP